MRRTMRISGAEALASALLVFFGIEASTAIAEYLRKMTRSELFVVMTAFMGTIAGSVLVIYVGFGAQAGHLVVASLMSAPAAVAIAKVMIPETEEPLTAAGAEFDPPRETVNVIDAAARGAGQGMKLALNIAAMLIAFVGLVFLVNLALGRTSLLFFRQPLTLERLMGWCFCPLAAAMGVPWDDIPRVAELLGIKTVLNEFLAYRRMSVMQGSGAPLQPRSVIIATYALCGFANLGSIAILVGGLSGIDPERRSLFARLGWRALVAGTLAAFMTACVAGMLY
jgi:CNT family concentrative nucleoside transporter